MLIEQDAEAAQAGDRDDDEEDAAGGNHRVRTVTSALSAAAGNLCVQASVGSNQLGIENVTAAVHASPKHSPTASNDPARRLTQSTPLPSHR